MKNWSVKKEATPGQISLAWLLAQKPWIVPIPGTTQMAHMIENTRVDAIKFSPDELQDFNKQLNTITIIGERLPTAVLQFSVVEAPLKKE